MNDSLGVRGVERVGDFDGEIKKYIEIKGTAADAMLQRRALHVFHADEHTAFVLADFVDRADVGVIQSRRGARFAAETLESLRIFGDILGKKLQSDEAAKFG